MKIKNTLVNILLFSIPAVIVANLVVIFFPSNQEKPIANLSRIPSLPSVSFSDLIKLSRFSIDKAPSQSLVGRITSLSGDIRYESRIATESSKINVAVDVQQGEKLATGTDGKIILNFKDAVDINIDSNSSINIIQTLPNDLVFWQTMGSVEYIKIGNYPVTIRVGHLIVENKGDTKISFTKDSPITTITVIDGTATVAYNNLSNNTKVVDVSAGQVLRFNEGTRRVVLK